MVLHQPDAHRIDDRVVGVAAIEVDLATDSRTAKAITVAADAGDDALKQVTISTLVQRTEPQGVQNRDRTCPHGKNISKDAAHAGRGTLVGLDRRRMIVRLDLEDDRQPVTDVDRPRVLAWSLEHVRALRRQLAQQRLRRLVGAVLTPQRAEHPELQVIRVATQGANDGTVLILLEGHGVELGPSHRQRRHTATWVKA